MSTRCMALIQLKNYRSMQKILQLDYEVKVLVKSKFLSRLKIIFKPTTLQDGGRFEVSKAHNFFFCKKKHAEEHANNTIGFVIGQFKRISKLQEKFDSDWLFLLSLGIIVALISFGLDFSIDKCQQGTVVTDVQ